MTTVDEIRESRKDGYWGSSVDGYECLEAEQHVDYLLAELDSLRAIEGAARVIVVDADSPQLARNWATDRLATALAAFDAAKGE
jgi:hypothetical protein